MYAIRSYYARADEIVDAAKPRGTSTTPPNVILVIISWLASISSALTDTLSLYITKTYITNPTNVPPIVPIGIDLDGFRRSPLKPTPAVIPVKAGKTIAKSYNFV